MTRWKERKPGVRSNWMRLVPRWLKHWRKFLFTVQLKPLITPAEALDKRLRVLARAFTLQIGGYPEVKRSVGPLSETRECFRYH